MALIEDKISNRNSIQAYESDHITINGKEYRGNLILSINKIISPWNVSSIDQIEANDLNDIFNLNPEVVLLGTGEKQIFPNVEIFGFFAQQNVGLEVMNTGALCRTFNILAAEDRNVVAAILQ